MALLDRVIAATIGWVPRPLMWRIAKRYVAGARRAHAIERVRILESEGCRATVDLLGEFVEDPDLARESADEYMRVLDDLAAAKLGPNVSIKLTGIGLMVGKDLALENLRRVVAHARGLGGFVRIDMEDSPWTDATIDLYRTLRGEGLDNVGLVLQAYLKRTLDDVRRLRDLVPSYRLCKGIYVEPEEIAYKDPERIRTSYREALREMVAAGSYVGIATHDQALIESALSLIQENALSAERYEFQMLLGVTEGARRRLVADGHPLRVYVPYGEDWYGYCVRRLKENPAIGRHVIRALFTRERRLGSTGR